MEAHKNLIVKILCLCTFVLLVASCSRKSAPETEASQIPPGSIPVTVIDYHELDGCEFLLQTEKNEKLQPVNLNSEYKVDGTRLYITFKYRDDMSICMAGRMIEIISVVPVKNDKK